MLAVQKIDDTNVSRETFSEYVNLLLKWNKKINLIGPATESAIWKRHIQDSLQLVPALPSFATSLVDLGSGAGLPGLVLALARPDLAITLVEHDQRKAAFLKEAKRLLGLSHVIVQDCSILNLAAHYDVITARALAPLTQLLDYALPLMKGESIALFPKGADYASELHQAQKHWQFNYKSIPSITHSDSSIILVSNLKEISNT